MFIPLVKLVKLVKFSSLLFATGLSVRQNIGLISEIKKLLTVGLYGL